MNPRPASFPKGTKFFDVDGIPVAKSPDGPCTAFTRSGDPYPFPNASKVRNEGDELTESEFTDWLRTGFNKFDVRPSLDAKASAR